MKDYLKTFVEEKKKTYPQLTKEITDLYQLCLDEIEGGGSVVHECELCISDIEDLILEETEG